MLPAIKTVSQIQPAAAVAVAADAAVQSPEIELTVSDFVVRSAYALQLLTLLAAKQLVVWADVQAAFPGSLSHAQFQARLVFAMLCGSFLEVCTDTGSWLGFSSIFAAVAKQPRIMEAVSKFSQDELDTPAVQQEALISLCCCNALMTSGTREPLLQWWRLHS